MKYCDGKGIVDQVMKAKKTVLIAITAIKNNHAEAGVDQTPAFSIILKIRLVIL